MKTIEIKHKDKQGNLKITHYVTVSERLKAIRKKQGFNISILTDIHTLNDEYVIFKAQLLDCEGRVISTGHAKEKAGDTFINKGSHIENCETSAVGRCLALAGYGIDAEIASADEVLNADKNDLITDKQKEIIDRMLHDSVLDERQKQSIENEMFDMTFTRAEDRIEYLSNHIKEPENMNQEAIKKKLDAKLNDPKS